MTLPPPIVLPILTSFTDPQLLSCLVLFLLLLPLHETSLLHSTQGMDAQATGSLVQVPGTPASIYTPAQQKFLFDIALKQADYEFAQAQLKGTVCLNVLTSRPAPGRTPPSPTMRVWKSRLIDSCL